ncbi:glycine receptor subunit alpha-2-like isoform X1 [Artemia franciscana]|uniref:glycine receptor subunit alpha-2-like isoform X1 n=1 Tax=Artemia franciscana TaxID=6661 RepID=UPI0032DA26A8
MGFSMIESRRNRQDIFLKILLSTSVLIILITGYASPTRVEGMDPVDLEFLEPGQSHEDGKLPRFSEKQSDKIILDQMLSKGRYDNRIIPPSKGPVIVNVSVLLLSLASPDESSLKYEVEFLMRQTWSDPRLRYNAGPHHFLNALHHHDDMWVPDTYFIKHGDFKEPSIPPHIALRVYRNGTVLYILRRHLILSCQGNLNIFPFDDPICSFSVESISYERDRMVYQWSDDEGTLRKTPSLSSLNAYLIENSTTLCPDRFRWRGGMSCLRVELVFTRDKKHYFTAVFVPGIFVVTSSFISFWLDWNETRARTMIGVTTMLNFFTTSNGFRSTLPVVSNLTAMNVWDGVCMCFIYASLLEFIAVNYVGRKRPKENSVYHPGENTLIQVLPMLIRRLRCYSEECSLKFIKKNTEVKLDGTQIIACTNCGPEPCTHTTANGCAAERRRESHHPIRIAKTIDVISRTVFPICFAVFLIFFFIQYKGFV